MHIERIARKGKRSSRRDLLRQLAYLSAAVPASQASALYPADGRATLQEHRPVQDMHSLPGQVPPLTKLSAVSSSGLFQVVTLNARISSFSGNRRILRRDLSKTGAMSARKTRMSRPVSHPAASGSLQSALRRSGVSFRILMPDCVLCSRSPSFGTSCQHIAGSTSTSPTSTPANEYGTPKCLRSIRLSCCAACLPAASTFTATVILNLWRARYSIALIGPGCRKIPVCFRMVGRRRSDLFRRAGTFTANS